MYFQIKINNHNFSYFNKWLLKAVGFNDLKNVNGTDTINLTKKLAKEWCEKVKRDWLDHRGIELTSRFYGIIPQETKEKIKEAESIFDAELYLIAETRPETWNVKNVTADPLLIGIFEDKSYLIDHFNTTPLENYVMREFIE